MLAYILAVLVGSGSVGLYLAAFFFPEIHRKQDFIWSGVGCFYALFLWIYAHQVTGGILVGQTTSVILLGWFGWQTFQLRRQLAPSERATAIANAIQLPKRNSEPKSAAKNPKANETAPTATPTPTPAETAKRSIDKTAAPAATKPTSSNKPATPATNIQPSIDRTVTVSTAVPLSEVKVLPANPPATTQQVEPTRPQPTTPATPNPEAEDDRAWIKLEVKPDSSRSKPLGTPVQPPTPLISAANPEITPSSQPVPTTDRTIPTVKIDPAEPT